MVLGELVAADPRVRGVIFAHNCGQTTAMSAGIQAARGPVVATMDADMQNDPGDLPGMLEKLPGHDAVVGWRMKRRDTFVRRASSRIANGIRNWISKDQVTDTGCSLKVFRTEAIQSIPLIAEQAEPGLYHATCNGECSWYEFAEAIFEETGTEVTLLKGTQSDFPSPVKRPDYSILENKQLQDRGLDVMPHWRDALREYLEVLSDPASD